MSPLPKKAKARLESSVKDEVKKLLGEFGWFHFMPPANMYGKSGISDILALKDGVFLAIECKENAVLTENQKRFLLSVEGQDGWAFVVRGQEGVKWLRVWLQEMFNDESDWPTFERATIELMRELRDE